MHLVENAMGGTAWIVRFHHCIGDGASMTYVMYRLMDISRDGGQAPLPLSKQDKRPAASSSLLGTLTRPVRTAYGLTKKTAGFVLREGIATVRDPYRLVDGANVATDSAAVVARMLRYPPDPATPIKGELGVQKRVAWSDSLPLDDVRLVAHTFEAKVNDVLMSVVAGALRDYLQAHGVEVDGLTIRAVVPVDLRHPSKAAELGNNFGLVFAALPVGLASPLDRLNAVRGKMTEVKQSPEAVVFLSMLNIFGHTPQAVEEQVVNLFGTRASAVLTNVAGPRQPLYLAGSRIDQMLFWVPQAGHLGLGISILSYSGQVLIGIIADAGLIPVPDEIADALNAEFAKLLALAQDQAN
jgi:WS/DGAT/MGAT family acyltransferase